MIFYVRNLSVGATEHDVRLAFESYGRVAAVTFLRHEHTGVSLGVAVVDMPETHEHQVLNNALVGVQIDGSDIQVGLPRTGGDRRQGRERRDLERGSRDRRATDRRVVQLSDYR